MRTSIPARTFLLFLLAQIVMGSLSQWLRSLEMYASAILIVIVPLAIISIVWPIHLRSHVEVVTSKAVLMSSIAGAGAILVSNVVLYVVWIYVRDGDLSNLWGKDIDALRVVLLFSILIFVVLYLLSFLVSGRIIRIPPLDGDSS